MNAPFSKPNALSNFQIEMGHRCSKALYYALKYPIKKKNLEWPSAAMKKHYQFQRRLVNAYLSEVRHSETSISARELKELENTHPIGSTFSGLISTPVGQWIRVDLLRRIETGWELLIVTGQTKRNKFESIFRQREYDVWRILRCFSVSKIKLVWNKEPDDDSEFFFVEQDITDYAMFRVAYSIDAYVDAFSRMREVCDEPEVAFGPYCGLDTDSACPFYKLCLPPEGNDNIFFLTKVSMDAKIIMARRGLHLTQDIPMTYATKSDESLVLNQSTVEQPRVMDSAIREWLSSESPKRAKGSRNTTHISSKRNPLYSIGRRSLNFPLAFLDFEADKFPLPISSKTPASDYFCFQYSLHYYLSENTGLVHREYLADPINDGNQHFLNSLLKDLEPVLSRNGAIVVYNASFEAARLSALKGTASDIQSELIDRILSNFVDIYTPFRKMYFLDRAQKGKTTLKAVYESILGLIQADSPVQTLAPLRHKDLRIKNGLEAVRGYWALNSLRKAGRHPGLQNRIRAMLLEYCALDTSSMIILLNYLVKISGLK